jgi:Tol biopolymer transport system component
MKHNRPVLVRNVFLSIFCLLAGVIPLTHPVVANVTEDHFIYLPVVVKPDAPSYKIVFTSDRGNSRGVYDIFVMNTDGTDIVNLTNTPDVAEHHPAWSPNGTMIAYLSGAQGSTEVYVMNNVGGNKRNVSNTPSADEKGLVWSPDSTRLAFLSDRDDVEGIYDVFVVNSNGTGLTNLTHSTDSDEWSLDWSPNSTKIVYLADLSLQSGLLGHIITMNADGTNKTTISTNNGFNLSPAWSPNGSKIAFIIPGFTSRALVMVDPDGANRTFITETGLIRWVMEGFQWNATGTKIAFLGQEASSSSVNLFVINVANGNFTNVTKDVPGVSTPFETVSWSADNTKLVYDENMGLQRGDISIIDITGTGYTNLTNSNSDDDRWPDWSPVSFP